VCVCATCLYSIVVFINTAFGSFAKTEFSDFPESPNSIYPKAFNFGIRIYHGQTVIPLHSDAT
jgi:hypothetical protein